jgi:hypothetical protein
MFAFTARCGRFRVTHAGDGFVTVAEYFDEAGRLVGADNSTDVLRDSPCPNRRHFGEEIKCEMTDVKDYCRSATSPPGSK